MEALKRSSSLSSSSSESIPRISSYKIKGPWSAEEDRILTQLVEAHGPRNWALISRFIKGRSGKSCRLRWCNQLSPAVEHRAFSTREDEVILHAHALFGNKWATIARMLPGRTDNAVKNHWNATLKRKASSQRRRFDGDDPLTALTLAPPGSESMPVSPPGLWDAIVVGEGEIREYMSSSFSHNFRSNQD
ncbi:hypothetical protein VNO78_28767 [Psophocarpus tetragonolobus]|uniref:Uncharacterized protein n=1 Tax=Psophocarpus tetragonolobus TaxID=3891 RepID=A0AAN9WYS7_PSOTE